MKVHRLFLALLVFPLHSIAANLSESVLTGEAIPDAFAFRAVADSLRSLAERNYQTAVDAYCVQMNFKPDPYYPGAKLIPKRSEVDEEVCRRHLRTILKARRALYQSDIAAAERMLCRPGGRPSGADVARMMDHFDDVKASNAARQLQRTLSRMTPEYQVKFMDLLNDKKRSMKISKVNREQSWQLAGASPDQVLATYCDRLHLPEEEGGGA